MKKHLIYVLLLLFGMQDSKAQLTQQQQLDLYWHYRWRLVNYFEVIGMGAGKSTPAAFRNGAFNSSNMEWADGPVVDGYYIGVLATEYSLLHANGQDCSETVMELYYALHAIFRLDSLADNLLASGSPTIPFSDFMGFVPTDDVPSTFVSDNSSSLNPSGTGNAGWVTGSGAPQQVSGTEAEYPGWVSNANLFPSVDQYGSLLMGLALAAEYAPSNNVTFTWYDSHGNLCSCTANLQQMAKQLGAGILNYIAYQSESYDEGLAGYLLWGPNGVQGPGPTYGGGGDAEPFEIPMSNLAGQTNIFNINIPENDFNVVDILSLLTGPFSLLVDAGTESGQIQLWNTYFGSCATFCQGDNTNEVLAILYTAIGNSWNSTQYSSARDEIQWLGGDHPCSPDCIYTTNHYGRNIFYQGVLTALYSSNDNLNDFDFCGAETMLSEAPSDGPFFHNSSDFAAGGWACDRRYIDSPNGQIGGMDANNQYPFSGNFNGLDYMLMYNLYCLCSQQAYSKTVVVPDGCTYPYEYPPFSECIKDLPPVGTTSQHFSIVSVNCAPIVVTRLNVTNIYGYNGGLEIHGGNEPGSYIDLNPSTGNIIVNSGGYFDAKCDYNCCSVNPNLYVNEYNDPNQHFDRPTKRNGDTNSTGVKNNTIQGFSGSSLPAYQKTIEFDTLFLQDGISCCPNPFRAQTTISFSLKHKSPVSIYLTDIKGNKLAYLVKNENYNYGSYQINFTGTSLATGTYICVLSYANNRKTIKIVKD